MSDKPVIRLAYAADLPDLVDLAARSFRDAFEDDNDQHDIEDYLRNSMSLENLEEEFRDAESRFLLACADDIEKLLGYAKLRNGSKHASVSGEAPIEVVRIYADSSMIGKGVGAALMTECFKQAHSLACDVIWLGVWDKNRRAIQFYERWGFSIVGEHEFRLGSDIQNDLIMSKSLSFGSCR